MTPKIHRPPERRLGFAESARGVTARLRDPLPPAVLAALDAKTRRAHAALAERAQKVAAERRRLATEVAAAPARDGEATAEAMRVGAEPPAPTEAKLRDDLAEAERLEAAAGEALRRSATALLNDAAPKLADVNEALVARAADDTDAIRAGIEDLRRQVLALGALHNEQGWIAGVFFADGRGVPAYIERPSDLDRTTRALAVLAETFAEEIRVRDERVVSASRQREHEADAARREARDRAERAEHERRERERQAEPSAEQAPGRVWGGRESLGG